MEELTNGDPDATFSAAEWIEAHKRSIKQNGQKYWKPQGSIFCIARIMAARQLSNSTRGKVSTLNKKLTARQIDEQALKLMANDNFYSFVEQLTKDESKLTSMLTKRYTHGGKLDDMFTKYMCSLPAGEMRNDPILERWMPTVKDRIEVLQKQAGSAIKKNDDETVQKAAVEIMLLRSMAQVRRGGEGLKVKVPVSDEKIGKMNLSLGTRVDAADYATQEQLKKADVAKYVRVGHGGKMAEMFLNASQKKTVVRTNADVARNNANVVRSNTNVVKTNADVVKTNANVVKSNTMKNVDIKKKQVTLS